MKTKSGQDISLYNQDGNAGSACLKIINKIISRLSLILLLSLSNASVLWAASEPPQTFTLDGQLFQKGGSSPLLDMSAKVKIQILNPTGTCLLYEEEQTVDTFGSGGFFSIHVGSMTGSAKRTVSDPGRSMNQVFQNTGSISANSVPGQTCAGSAYAPAAGDVRYIRVTVTPSASNQPDVLTPDIVMDSVPNAVVAQSVQGLERTGILQVHNAGSVALTQSNLEALFTTPAYANLQAVLAGSFIKTDTSGATLPTYAADPAGAANGDIWFDSVTNEIKYKTAAGIQTVGAAGSGISSLTVGSSMSVNGTVAGTISGSGTIDLSNTGVTAGTYTKMTVDEKGRVTAGTVSLVEGDIPNLTSAGKVSGNTITSGTISGSAGVNTSGNLVTTATVSGLTVQATNVRIFNGANYLQMTASTMSGNVNLTMPATTGSAGQFLSTDGNGILSWSGITSLLAGDVSGAFGATSVDKIKGKAVTAATVSGQMMIYDGTAWGNSVMSGDATLAHDGLLTLNKVPVSKGGTNAVTFGNNKIISSNGTGSTLQDFSCSLNQVISFDASGYAVCANVSSLSGAILNGGNTTGADISIGTNDNKALQFKTNNTVAMTISQGGNVGIGTAAPTLALHLFKDTTSGSTGDGILIETVTSSNIWYGPTVIGRNKRASGTTDDKGILLGLSGYSAAAGNGTGEAAKINLLSDGVPGFLNFPGRIDFSTTPTGGNTPETRMTIRQDGNIGIGGITAPTTALHMSGAFTAQAMSSAPSVSAVNTGRIYYDYSANKFKVSQNGAAYTDLLSSGGITSLGGQSGATQTLAISVDNSVALPTITSATNAHTWKIPMASNAGTTAGLLNKTDYDLFAAKLGTTTSFAGDVSGAYNATVVQKIQGKDITAGSVSGQMMIYNGTAWTNNVMSGDATLAHDGMFVLNKVPVAKGGTNATTFGNNRIIASNGTGTAFQDFTCSLNQVISFDASGNAACSNVSSLFAGILNGGNTTGADISIGTNDNKALSFKVNNATAVTISQNGNVGVGTAAPASKMHLYDSDGGSVTPPQFIAQSTGATWASFFASHSYGNALFWSSNKDMRFGTSATNIGGTFVETVRMTASGRVGIGTDTPSTALDVSGASNYIGIAAPTVSPSNEGRIYYDRTANKFKVSQNGAAFVDLVGPGLSAILNGGNTTGADISIGTNDNKALHLKANNTIALTISQGGRVGIGTNAPAEKLHVSASETTGVGVIALVENTASTGQPYAVFQMKTAGAIHGTFLGGGAIDAWGLVNGITMGAGTNTQDIGFRTGSALTGAASGPSMIIKASGDVGIGTKTPRAALDVSGALVVKPAVANTTGPFDFSLGNMQYTTNSCGAFALHNLKDGGSYMFIVQGATSATCSFTAFSDAGTTALTVHLPPDHSSTVASKHTMYNLAVVGTHVYIAWTPNY